MRPCLVPIEGGRGNRASVPDPFSSGPRDFDEYPVERVLRDRIRVDASWANVRVCPYGRWDEDVLDRAILRDHLGTLDRWDEDDCQRIRDETVARPCMPSSFNETFVAGQLSRVGFVASRFRRAGEDGPVGTRVRATWITDPLADFTLDLDRTHRRLRLPISRDRRSYLRALFVSCLMHVNVGRVHAAAEIPQTFFWQSGPNG